MSVINLDLIEQPGISIAEKLSEITPLVPQEEERKRYWIVQVVDSLSHESPYKLTEKAVPGLGTFVAPDREAAEDFCIVCLEIPPSKLKQF
ncbi:MAG TPA: hypothetical protein P5280_02380 [Cyclobacteriaceae bacterium]|nr:hypothetical protein [Cyclobacteriaceae bacterium]